MQAYRLPSIPAWLLSSPNHSQLLTPALCPKYRVRQALQLLSLIMLFTHSLFTEFVMSMAIFLFLTKGLIKSFNNHLKNLMKLENSVFILMRHPRASSTISYILLEAIASVFMFIPYVT